MNAYLCDVSVSGEIRVLGVTTLSLLDSGAIHLFKFEYVHTEDGFCSGELGSSSRREQI
ncbi:hypothetical protein F511_32689 [Dorcoceras hygrometricum]|uniref:Uncharacterized protein n=1 Tax=Dorcoceras hygrometricum TaxID=472368 RepID=A0A2Z7CLA9_9LAMI|nr:hypothetical protein F511_32689 [Dorcoceras hygrometricum]